MREPKSVTFETFLEAYRPLPNLYQNNETDIFSTEGEQWEYIKTLDPRYVWTLVSGDDGDYILNGFHFVNRLGYYVTEYPLIDPTGNGVIVELP